MKNELTDRAKYFMREIWNEYFQRNSENIRWQSFNLRQRIWKTFQFFWKSHESKLLFLIFILGDSKQDQNLPVFISNHIHEYLLKILEITNFDIFLFWKNIFATSFNSLVLSQWTSRMSLKRDNGSPSFSGNIGA